ncbi:hypothetical protein V6R21_21160 [Limibacter armeniacum]|uniref:hypothetical protein n=1 Tax=Limibacter armeniacum TaxID=466084 RepID=UPI002FE52C47
MIRYNFFGVSSGKNPKVQLKTEQETDLDFLALLTGPVTSVAKEEIISYLKDAEGLDKPFDECAVKANVLSNRLSESVAAWVRGEQLTLSILGGWDVWVLRGRTELLRIHVGEQLNVAHNVSIKKNVVFSEDDVVLIGDKKFSSHLEESMLVKILADRGLTAQGKSDLLYNLSGVKKEEDPMMIVVLESAMLPSKGQKIELENTMQKVQEVAELKEDYSKTYRNERRNAILTFSVFVAFTALVLMLHRNNEAKWESRLEENKTLFDSLSKDVTLLSDEVEAFKKLQAKEVGSIKATGFDPYDGQHFRMYGLLRDKKRVYTRTMIAEKFNIYNPAAIEYKDAMDERWFIVPVKGVHYVKKGETAFSIGKLYYKNPKNHKLIQDFNPKINAGRYIFIPFEQ